MIWLIFGVIGILVWGVISLIDSSDEELEVYKFEKRKALAQLAHWEYIRTDVLPLMKGDINRQWELADKLIEEDV